MSTGELREKLKRKAEKVGDVDGVIAKLKDYGYLNDKQYAEMYASRRLENEGFGKARVLSDLRSKRVAPAVAERAVNQTFAATDEVELIEQFLARKYRRTPLAEVLAEPLTSPLVTRCACS
jgi:regulatory protein